MSWLSQQRTEHGVERILDAAAELFVEHGIGQPGMEDVARAAGCSRATVYRYFDNKPALLQAFVHREAQDVMEQVAKQVKGIRDEHEAVVAAVVATLAAVRARPSLHVWYGDDASALHEVFRESPVITDLASTFLAPDQTEPDLDLGRWLLRVVLSFLRDPGDSPDEERRLIERFLVPPKIRQRSAN